jgi:hypothetical protein
MIGDQAYIKNVGSTQTFIKNPYKKEQFNDIHWEADYDGNQANIHLNIDDNGNNTEIRANLDNNDLAQLLNIPTIRGDLDKRLYDDFHNPLNPLFPKVDQKPTKLILMHEKLYPKLKYQPFLRPQKTHRVKYNKLAKRFKEPTIKLVGKTAALKYRTPLPKTMRIHLTSPTEFTAKPSAKSGIASGTRKSHNKQRRSKRSASRSKRSGVGLFRNLF